MIASATNPSELGGMRLAITHFNQHLNYSPMWLPRISCVPHRLKNMHERLSTALSNPLNPSSNSSSSSSSPWPTIRTLLQLKLLTTLFPVSDRRHPVITPAALLVCKYLSQCVAGSTAEAACGLMLAGLALHITSPAQRYAPEPLAFLTDGLWSFLEPGTVSAPLTAKGAKAGVLAKQKGSSADAAAPGNSSTGREDGLSMPRVLCGALAPEARGAALAAVQPQELQLLPWLERVNSHAGSSSSDSSRDGQKRAGKRRDGVERGGKGEEDGFKLGMMSTMLKVCWEGWHAEAVKGCKAWWLQSLIWRANVVVAQVGATLICGVHVSTGTGLSTGTGQSKVTPSFRHAFLFKVPMAEEPAGSVCQTRGQVHASAFP